jgi:hypothetical protein
MALPITVASRQTPIKTFSGDAESGPDEWAAGSVAFTLKPRRRGISWIFRRLRHIDGLPAGRLLICKVRMASALIMQNQPWRFNRY